MYLLSIYFGSSCVSQHAVKKEDERLILPFIQVTATYSLFKKI